VEWHNTVFTWSGLLYVHKLFTSCIRRCLVLRACNWVMSALSAALLIFSFQFSLLLFHISVARAHQNCGVLLVLIPNIGHHKLPKIWMYLSCVECTVQGKDFELILMVKMETQRPIEGQIGSEFPAISNQCRVMMACRRKTWKFWAIFAFFKRPLTLKFSKFCFKSFYLSGHLSLLPSMGR